MGTHVVVDRFPPCDFCVEVGVVRPAAYDGATRMGSWASMCPAHFKQYGIGLGIGRGQKLILKSALNGLGCSCGFSDNLRFGSNPSRRKPLPESVQRWTLWTE